jgi:hydrogenase expression/formation protein HypC
MCLAIPSKIVSIDDGTAVVDVYGARRVVSLLLMEDEIDIGIGDYVLVHAGFAIQKVDEEYAKESLDLLKQMAGIEKESEE